jgi:four helix bundle protein
VCSGKAFNINRLPADLSNCSAASGSMFVVKFIFMKGFKQLDAWNVAMELVKEIYSCAQTFPSNELYGLASQAKRAAVSIPSNIAEGMGRQNKKETIHFLHIARGSAYELETLLHVAVMTKILKQESFDKIIVKAERTRQLLHGLIAYLKKDENLK